MTPVTAALTAVLASQGPFPGSVTDQAVVWNGFDQAWAYNHRLSRLGSYVGGVRCDAGGCDAPLVHAAATGSGSDVARYRSRVTTVRAPNVGFLQGSTLFRAEDDRGEGSALRYATTVEVPVTGLLAERDQVEVVLGGFDIVSKADPDKLAELALSVGPAAYTDRGHTLSFEVVAEATFDCDSLECDRFDRGVDYDITVVWTVLAGDDEIAVTNDRAAVDYDWRSKRELDGADFVTDRVMEGLASSFDAAFVAFRSLSVTLDDDHHMQQWATSVVPGAYDAAAGLQQVAVELFFKQWNQRSRARVFSYAERGRAAMKADLAMVQLRGGETASREVVGDVRWRADGGPPDPARSVAVTRVSLP